MAENVPPPSANGNIPGQPFYEKTRAHLRELLRKKRDLERQLASQEEMIYKKETDYLEETPSGNIITGFEAYTKGVGSAIGGARKRGLVTESNRVFSKSSVSYGAAAESPMPSAHSTPAAGPTPVSTSFLKGESGSNHATPTSSTSINRIGAGLKKNKKPAGEDSETDTKETKKARTNFSVTRK